MTHSILDNKRRLERHSRRDGDLQSRARPVMKERNDDQQHQSSAGYIRELVESVNQDGVELFKRLVFSPNSEDDTPTSTSSSGTSSANGGNESESQSSTDGSRSGNTGSSTSDDSNSASTSTARQNNESTSSSSPSSSTYSSTSQSTADTRTRTSTTPTSTRITSTSTTPTSTRTTSSSSDILTTTAAAATTSAGLATSVAYVTASGASTSTLNNAAASSTSTSKSTNIGAGPVIGIVAGSLAGIAVIAVIIGFLFKKFGHKEDPYESDPFDRDEFRRHSAMLPETFESEDGHPSMMEHSNLHGSMGGPFSDAGYGGAGYGGMAAASAYTSHNESGRPRPPTMFQKHINGPGAQYNVNDSGVSAPQVGAIYNPDELTPQLPPMAFGGSDPYSSAGVGRNHQFDNNMNNPYAHLDRSMSTSMQQQGQRGQTNEMEGQNMYADLNRNASNGSYANGQYGNEHESTAHGYNTTGRPGTSEGRSGTPDLPNVQQTYALGDGSENGHQQEMDRANSPHRIVASPQHMSQDMYAQYQQYQQYQQGPYHEGSSPPQQPLQVRNLLPNSQGGQSVQQTQRPISTASSQAADDDAAYGGVW